MREMQNREYLSEPQVLTTRRKYIKRHSVLKTKYALFKKNKNNIHYKVGNIAIIREK